MFTVDFRFEENQTTIEFPCNEKYLSAKFDELGVEDKLKTSQYMIGTNYAALKRLVTDFADAVIACCGCRGLKGCEGGRVAHAGSACCTGHIWHFGFVAIPQFIFPTAEPSVVFEELRYFL